MKIGTIVVLAGVGITAITAWSSYNGLVEKEEAVNTAWADVENVYQRRADLVPSLVETVKGAAQFEQGTFTAVAEARASVGQIKLTAADLSDPKKVAAFEAAQTQLSGALSRLLVTVEKYPDLKATANFRDLQAQLEGTENRIAVERRKFNESARVYNVARRTFPRSIFASMFGFQPRAQFQAQTGADKAPPVKF